MRIVLLSDTSTSLAGGLSRYMGPYVIGTRLEEAGYEVVIADWFLQHPEPLSLIRSLLTSDTLFVGLSSTFLTNEIPTGKIEQVPTIRSSSSVGYYGQHLWLWDRNQLALWFSNLRAELDQICPEAKIVIGGTKGGALLGVKEEYLQSVYQEVDYIVVGTADDSVVDLANDLRDGKIPLSKSRGGVRFVEPSLFGKYSNQCPPTSMNPNWAIQSNEGLPIEIARGCLYNCKFCHFDKKFSNRKDIDALRDEFVRNYETWGTSVYHFCDDCFNDTRPKVEAVCNMLTTLPFKIEWVSYARADLSIKFPDTMDMMMESGARGLFFGIETFNYESGRAAGKGVHPDKVKQFLIDTYQKYSAQCLFECGFIVGLPHETEQSQMATFEWLNKFRPLDFAAIRALVVYEYNADMDETIIDYADYIRNPLKYGFSKITFDPPFWEHLTMNSIQAKSLERIGEGLWKKNRKPAVRMIWSYPALRSLGYQWDQIAEMARNPLGDEQWAAEIRTKRVQWLKQYWRDLARLNRPVQTL